MKISFSILVFVFLVFLFAACDEEKEIVQPECKKYIELSFPDYNSMNDDPYQIGEARLDGNCLTISLKYSGGCKEHQVDLALILPECATPPLPTPTFEIRHNANNDMCEALITKEYQFDISGIKDTGKTQSNFILAEKDAAGIITTTTFTYKY